MEERMYRAQMEVSLFSKAIANLCEELKTKCRPCKSRYLQMMLDASHTNFLYPSFMAKNATRTGG